MATPPPRFWEGSPSKHVAADLELHDASGSNGAFGRGETLKAKHVNEHLCRMVARIYLVIDSRNVAVLVD
jgi:hypothetical protein